MHKTNVPKEIESRICELYPQNHTADEIANLLNLTKRVVLRILKENNIELRKCGGRFKGGFAASWERNKHKYEATRKNKQSINAKLRDEKKRHFSDEEKASIIKQYVEYKTGMVAIGLSFGLTKRQIKKLLIEWGVAIDHPGQKYRGGSKETTKRYNIKHRDRLREYHKEWSRQHPDRKAITDAWRTKNINKIRERARKIIKNKIDSDPQFKLQHNTKYAVWASLKDKHLDKVKRTFEILPYTPHELKKHLEKQFDSTMNWENYGKWHVDHIVPISQFTYESEDDIGFQQCWDLSNLRPMWGKNNCSKNNKLNDLTFETIEFLAYDNDNVIKNKLLYKTPILTKEYLIDYKNKFGKEKMKEYIPSLVQFLRLYHPEFPYPPLEEYLSSIKSKIKSYDFASVYWDEKSFKNASSTVGNNYLKHLFKEYWQCNYQNNLSPVECWKDDRELGRIIAWRIGINNSDETYEFSPRLIIRGISAARQSISFFKPLVAAAVYKHYNVDNKENLTVFDPCAGFGGRMLGFKSLYPAGKYIALEPNKHTFKNLEILGSELGGCELYKTTLEAFDKQIEYDFAFTSIPYFDMEKYEGEETYYEDFEDWRNTFINKLLTCPRLIVNMSMDLCEKLGLNDCIDTYLVSPPSHFAKTREPKKEVIIKVNF